MVLESKVYIFDSLHAKQELCASRLTSLSVAVLCVKGLKLTHFNRLFHGNFPVWNSGWGPKLKTIDDARPPMDLPSAQK